MSRIQEAINNPVFVTAQKEFDKAREAMFDHIPMLLICNENEGAKECFSWVCERSYIEHMDKIKQYTDACYVDACGGCIVTSADDLNVLYSFPVIKSDDTADAYSKTTVQIAEDVSKEFNLNLWVDGNDIICENGKVAGTSFVNNCNTFQMGISLSLKDHKEIIDKIGLPYDDKKKPYFIEVDKDRLFEVINNAVLNTLIDEPF